MKKKFSYLALIALTTIFLSFYQKSNKREDFTPLMQERYNKSLSDYLANRHTKCLEAILEDAEIYVDSVIINEINILLLDTIIFPEKPIKPNYPDTIILNDSVAIKPE